ncbi:MAG: hypothetical protein K2X49_25695 [Acetobacteraceae bacterium]|nr:hypothetical protein [Acetobacteraceae bacterium]
MAGRGSLTANALIEGFERDLVLADKAHGNNALRRTVAEMEVKPAVPSTRARKLPDPAQRDRR